jgi:addiction module RelB/DinJ family antitoxin
MSKVLQVRVDETLKLAADRVFSEIGLDTSSAVRMFLAAAVEQRGLPFSANSHKSIIEIYDGYGSYICDYGHVHDYSRMDRIDQGKVSRSFPSAAAAIASMLDDDSDDEI